MPAASTPSSPAPRTGPPASSECIPPPPSSLFKLPLLVGGTAGPCQQPPTSLPALNRRCTAPSEKSKVGLGGFATVWLQAGLGRHHRPANSSAAPPEPHVSVPSSPQGKSGVRCAEYCPEGFEVVNGVCTDREWPGALGGRWAGGQAVHKYWTPALRFLVSPLPAVTCALPPQSLPSSRWTLSPPPTLSPTPTLPASSPTPAPLPEGPEES